MHGLAGLINDPLAGDRQNGLSFVGIRRWGGEREDPNRERRGYHRSPPNFTSGW